MTHLLDFIGKTAGANIYLSQRKALMVPALIAALVITAGVVGFGWVRIACGGFVFCEPTRELREVAIYFSDTLFSLVFFCIVWTMGKRLMSQMYSALVGSDPDDLDPLNKMSLLLLTWTLYFGWLFRFSGAEGPPGVEDVVKYLVVGGGLVAWIATRPIANLRCKQRGQT